MSIKKKHPKPDNLTPEPTVTPNPTPEKPKKPKDKTSKKKKKSKEKEKKLGGHHKSTRRGDKMSPPIAH